MDVLPDVLAKELLLEKWQFKERTGAQTPLDISNKYLEVDCLVHEDWIKSAITPANPLPRCAPPFSHEEVHWMLQPSCWSTPNQPWQRIHICCFQKPKTGKASRKRYLVPQTIPNTDSVHAFLTSVAHETLLSSWRDFQTQLDKTNSTSADEDEVTSHKNQCATPLTTSYMSQLIKALYDKQLRPLVPIPSKEDVTPSFATPLHSPSSVSDITIKPTGHENLSPLLAAIESEDAFYLIYRYNRFTLFDCISHSPAMLEGSAKPLFVVFQLLQLLLHCHTSGITLGDINLKNVYIDARLWVQYYLPPLSLLSGGSKGTAGGESPLVTTTDTLLAQTKTERLSTNTSSQSSKSSIQRVYDSGEYSPPALTLTEGVTKWRSGELSNFDYIMLLNYHAGRRLGDPNNHPIFPWVTDFQHKNGNLRDLSCSKHRLAKGDTQLDFTYGVATNEMMRRPASTLLGSVVPHHIGDIASDVTYYVYKARQTTKDVLCARVRPNWVPEQYPLSIEKMYSWTPDEAIPEFFMSPELFYSIHSDLPDLQVPEWCSSPEEFVRIHRNLLESDQVSANLNHWIDLTFGSKLSGEAAVKAKNVYLSLVDGHTQPINSGIVQLFRSMHPKRIKNTSAPYAIFQWQRYLATSSLMNLTTFDIPLMSRNRSSLSDNSDDEAKSFSTILHGTNLQRSPDMRGTKGGDGIDDGSFEHVPYPLEIDDTAMTPEQSAYPGEGFYNAAMMGKPTKNLPQQGRQTGDVGMASDQTNKPAILRNILQRSKRPVSSADHPIAETYEWQFAGINMPLDSQPIQALSNTEELGYFLNKSCNDYGNMCQKQWTPDDLLMLQAKSQPLLSQKITDLLKLFEAGKLLSYEERVLLDIVGVVCVAIEMIANKHVRPTLPVQESLIARYSSIKDLLKTGRLHVPYCLQSLTDVIFRDKIDNVASTTIVEMFPTFNSSTLLQQFLPLIPFPGYFNQLYNMVSEMESRASKIGLSLSPWKNKFHSARVNEDSQKEIPSLISYSHEQCLQLFPSLDHEGNSLLLLYIQPLFENPSTSFEAVSALFEPVSSFLGKRNIQQSFLVSFLNVFDDFDNPIQRYNLLNRSIANSLITVFGLALFLTKFLNYYVEAIIEPMGHPYKHYNHYNHDTKSRPTTSRSEFSHTSHPLSPTTSSSAKHSITYNWREEHGIHSDEDDSDVDEDMSFPDASILETKMSVTSTMSVFGLLADIEETELFAQDDASISQVSPSTKKTTESQIILSQRESDSAHVSPPNTKPQRQSQSFSRRRSDTIDSIAANSSPQKAPPTLSSPRNTSLTISAPPTTDDNDLVNSPQSISEPSPCSSLTTLPHPPMISVTPSIVKGVTTEGTIDNEGDKEDSLIMVTDPSTVDPRLQVLSQRITEVASDCLIWLVWRLGPLLATKHIISALLENFHRCFTGICVSDDSNVKSIRSGLDVIVAFVEYYGEETILHLLVPFIRQQVTGLIKRSAISIRSESNIAASLSLLELVIKYTVSSETLLAIMADLSTSYFQPLLTLLSSSNHLFPSGSQARLSLAHSLVELLKLACIRLGASRSAEVLMDVLKCFFTCYSMAHGKEITTTTNNGDLLPVEEHFGPTGEPNATTSTNANDPKNDVMDSINSAAMKQVLITFAADFVHDTYVHFCRVIGQIQMNRHLCNIDAIDDLHTQYSERMSTQSDSSKPCVTSILTLRHNDTEDVDSSSNSDASSECSAELDLVYQLGPSLALHGKTGLGRDATNFGTSSWFVEMDENGDTTGGTSGQQTGSHSTPVQTASQTGQSTSHSTSGLSATLKRNIRPSDNKDGVAAGGGVAQGQSTAAVVATDPQSNSSLDRNSALFEAKFRPVEASSMGNGLLVDDDTTQDVNCALHGEWAQLWLQQAFRDRKYDSYEQFNGVKLQSYTGHRSTVKSLCVADSEHYFASGSKDKTIKIWSLYNQGDGSSSLSPQLTYTQHTKPLTKVDIIDFKQNVVSCDGTVHLWDIETNYCIQQFTSRQTTHILTTDVLHDSRNQLAVATSDFNLKFVDLRTKSFQHSWRTFFPTGGSIRFLSSYNNWLAVGNINGFINIIDLRTGELTYHWKPTEKWSLPQSGWSENLTHMKITDRGNLLTSTGAGLISLWKPNSKPLNHFRGHTASTPCLEMYGDHLLTVSSNGSVLVHGSFEYTRDNVISSCRIKMKGGVSCSSAIQLNQLLLLGGETGQITLMA